MPAFFMRSSTTCCGERADDPESDAQILSTASEATNACTGSGARSIGDPTS